MPMPKKRLKTMRDSFLAVAIAVFFLLLLEGSLRLYFHFKYGVSGKSYGIWRSDTKLGATLRANAYNSTVITNNYGFRNTEDVIDPKPDGALRIIAYGGSTTFCFHLLNHETWPHHLQQLLRTKRNGGEHDQVLNGGAVAWSISHLYARMQEEVPKFRPDYVLLYTGINEFAEHFRLKLQYFDIEDRRLAGEHELFSTNMEQNNFVLRNFLLVKILKHFKRTWISNVDTTKERLRAIDKNFFRVDPSLIVDHYLSVLQKIYSYLDEQGVTPIFITQISDESKRNHFYTSYSRTGGEALALQGRQVIDPSPLMKKYFQRMNELFFSTGIHFTDQGAKEVAEYIFERAALEVTKAKWTKLEPSVSDNPTIVLSGSKFR